MVANINRCALLVAATFFVVAAHVVGARADVVKARFSVSVKAESLLSKSIAMFRSSIAQQLADALELENTPLGNSREIREGFDADATDIAVLAASVFPSSIGAYVLGTDISGSRQRQESEVGAYQLAQLEKEGLVGVTFWNAPPRKLVFMQTVEKLDDLKGKKIAGVGGPAGEILKEMGATTLNLVAAELFVALVRGAVDGAALPPDAKLDVGAFKSVTTDATGTTEFLFVVRMKFWQSLPYQTQVKLAKAARVAAKQSDQVAMMAVRKDALQFPAQGLKLVSFTAAEKLTLKAASIAAWSRTADSETADLLARAYFVSAAKTAAPSGPATNAEQSRVVFFSTVRAAENGSSPDYRFGNRRKDSGPNYGRARVTLHAGRRLEDPLEDNSTIETLELFPSRTEFKAAVSTAPGFAETTGVLIFIHGYNSSFPDAIRRAAQFAVDIQFVGPVVAFSWPSDGTTLLYAHDEDRIGPTRQGFYRFMEVLESVVPRNRINILAHSMGTRVILNYTTTLQEIGNDPAKGKYRNLLLAASDTPIEFLRVQKDFLPKIANRITVYFSEKDRALWLSSKLHQKVRLGNIPGDDLFIEPESAALGDAGFDFINAMRIDKAFWTFSPRHGYVFQKIRGIEDVKMLLIEEKGALVRNAENPAALAPRKNAGNRFWELAP